jgi:hypothetical protein
MERFDRLAANSKLSGPSLTRVSRKVGLVADRGLQLRCGRVQDRRPMLLQFGLSNARQCRSATFPRGDAPPVARYRARKGLFKSTRVGSLCFEASETADDVLAQTAAPACQSRPCGCASLLPVHASPEGPDRGRGSSYPGQTRRRRPRGQRRKAGTPERTAAFAGPTDSRHHPRRRKSRVRGYSTDRSSGGIFATNPGVWPWSWNRARRLASASYELTG